jgi:hypothetical protein
MFSNPKPTLATLAIGVGLLAAAAPANAGDPGAAGPDRGGWPDGATGSEANHALTPGVKTPTNPGSLGIQLGGIGNDV